MSGPAGVPGSGRGGHSGTACVSTNRSARRSDRNMASASAYDLRFDSGRLCLDLVATVSGRLSEAPVERLDGVDRLKAWLVDAGLVPRGTALDVVDGSWLARFRAARDLLHRIVHNEVEGRAAGADLERVNSLAATAPPAVRAVRSADGTLVRRLAAVPDRGALLAQVGRGAVELQTDPVAGGQLRQCE